MRIFVDFPFTASVRGSTGFIDSANMRRLPPSNANDQPFRDEDILAIGVTNLSNCSHTGR